MKDNILKKKIKTGEVVVGTFLFTSSPVVLEILGYAGIDFVIIDAEHAPTGTLSTDWLCNLVRAAETSGIVPLVRIPEKSKIMTQKVLDSGAAGVVVPFVQTANDMKEVVNDCRYPPQGNRGACYLTRAAHYSIDFTPEYWEKANKNVMVVPLIENKEGLDNLEEIVKVDGVDFVFFGGRDYSMTCGFSVVDNPETNRAKKVAEEICRKHGKPLAKFLYPPFEESVSKTIEEGGKVMVAGGDVALLYQSTRSLVETVNKLR